MSAQQMPDYLGKIHHWKFGHGRIASVPTFWSYFILIPAGQADAIIVNA